jgi:hypothetical protein
MATTRKAKKAKKNAAKKTTKSVTTTRKAARSAARRKTATTRETRAPYFISEGLSATNLWTAFELEGPPPTNLETAFKLPASFLEIGHTYGDPTATDWRPTSQVFINAKSGHEPVIMFGNTATLVFKPRIPVQWPLTVRGPWTLISLRGFSVPNNAQWALIGGILIVTGVADMMMAFRRPGDTEVNMQDYHAQCFNGIPGGGARTNFSIQVPLVNGAFEAVVGAARYPHQALPLGASPPAVGWNVKLWSWGM